MDREVYRMGIRRARAQKIPFKEKYGYQIEENEYTYLTIHIARLLR